MLRQARGLSNLPEMWSNVVSWGQLSAEGIWDGQTDESMRDVRMYCCRSQCPWVDTPVL